MPPLRKPKQPDVPPVDVITARKTMFMRWIDECELMQEAIVESLLSQMESSRDG